MNVDFSSLKVIIGLYAPLAFFSSIGMDHLDAEFLAAAKIDDITCIKELLAHHPITINIQDDAERTALDYAVSSDNTQLVELLLTYKASPNISSQNSFSPLAAAVTMNNCCIAKMLLKAGAHVNAQESNQAIPLHYATTVELAELLLSYGASITTDLVDNEIILMAEARQSDLKAAVQQDNLKQVITLLHKNYCINSKASAYLTTKCQEAFTAIASQKHTSTQLVEQLLKNGLYLSIRDRNGNTLLHKAIEHKNLELVQLLVSLYSLDLPRALAKKNHLGQTPIDLAPNCPKILQFLMHFYTPEEPTKAATLKREYTLDSVQFIS